MPKDMLSASIYDLKMCMITHSSNTHTLNDMFFILIFITFCLILDVFISVDTQLCYSLLLRSFIAIEVKERKSGKFKRKTIKEGKHWFKHALETQPRF